MGFALLAVALAALVHPYPQALAGPPDAVVARNPYPFPVTLSTPRGLVVLEPGGEALVPAGLTCVLHPQVYYVGEGERFRLQGLLADGLLSGQPCASPKEEVEPLYSREYRVLLVSDPPGVVYRELWGPAGGRVEVEAPGFVEEEFARYRLEGLLLPGGVRAPGPRVELGLSGPAVVVAVYSAEYRVLVDVVGREYWHGGGPLLIPVEELTVVRGGVRLVPVKLIAGDAVVEARDGYFAVPQGFKGVLKPVFRKEYLLVVEGPQGERREWVPEGETRVIEFPGVIEVSPEERLVYRGALLDGTPLDSPRVEVVADRPHRVEAVYERQYLVRVTSVMGTSSEWAAEGSLYTLSLPRVLPGGLFTQLEMTAVIVNGEAMPGLDVLRVPVDGPLNIVVVYTPKPVAWRIALAAIPLTLLSAAAALQLYRWLAAAEEEAREALGRGKSGRSGG